MYLMVFLMGHGDRKVLASPRPPPKLFLRNLGSSKNQSQQNDRPRQNVIYVSERWIPFHIGQVYD